MSFLNLKDKVETLQAAATVVALIVGGVWTYKLFLEERNPFPHANIEQQISHVVVSKHVNILRVGVNLTNAGTAILLSSGGIIRIQQVVPLDSCKVNRPGMRGGWLV